MGSKICFFTFMHCVFWLSFLQLTALHHITGSLQPLCHDNKRFALLQFKESLTIEASTSRKPSAYPKMSSWKLEDNSHDCCFWDGIECNEDSGHVTKLDLTSSCLYGSIDSNSSLFYLVHLEWLSLADNDFNQSEILSTIIKLSKLSHLNLSSSGLVGQIPQDILNLTQLVSLDLSGVLISSSIPHVMANLSSLTHLSLERCGLQGIFPIERFRLPNLYSLNEASNQELRGYLPEFQESSPLTELKLADTGFQGNHLMGSIPQRKQFNTFENSSFEGNTRLCGKPLSRAYENFDETREEEIHQGLASLFELIDWKIVALGCAIGLIAGVVLGHIFCETKGERFLMIFGRNLKNEDQEE